nr:GHKL domain-containing protein [Clostridium botulinum]
MINSVSVLANIVTILIGFFSTYIIFGFISKLERNLYYKRYVYILVYFIFTAIIFISKIYCDSIMNLIITVVSIVVVGHFFYNNKKIYILYYSIYPVILSIFQVSVGFLFQNICRWFDINFYNLDMIIITSSIIVQLANLSASRLCIILYRNKKIKMITYIQLLQFLIFPLFSCFYITVLMMYFQVYLSIKDTTLIIISVISIIILNIFITNILESISKNNELKNKIVLYEEKSKIQYEYYNKLENNYKNSRKIIHDMKNHLQTIENLYSLNEYEDAQKYTEDMYELFDKFVQKYYTRNKVLNVIINDKVEKAKNLGINLECKIGDIDLAFIKDIDLTTIFSNLLDNAIESTKGVLNHKNIVLKINRFNEFLVINIVNPISECPIKIKTVLNQLKKTIKELALKI